jgi:hypothetical protein
MGQTKETELKLDDVSIGSHMRGKHKVIKNVYATHTVVKHSPGEEFLTHSDGSKWSMLPHCFNCIPDSICYDLQGRADIDIISNEEAGTYIEKARAHAVDINKDVIEYNKQARVYNKREQGREGFKHKLPHKMRRGLGITKSPYTLYVEAKDAKDPVEPSPPALDSIVTSPRRIAPKPPEDSSIVKFFKKSGTKKKKKKEKKEQE